VVSASVSTWHALSLVRNNEIPLPLRHSCLGASTTPHLPYLSLLRRLSGYSAFCSESRPFPSSQVGESMTAEDEARALLERMECAGVTSGFSSGELVELANLIAEKHRLRKALEFYANQMNYMTPSTGFAIQYDPEPSAVSLDSGHIAREALK
jgi:hypothetical protein